MTVQVPNPLPKAMRSRVVPNKNLAGTNYFEVTFAVRLEHFDVMNFAGGDYYVLITPSSAVIVRV